MKQREREERKGIQTNQCKLCSVLDLRGQAGMLEQTRTDYL